MLSSCPCAQEEQSNREAKQNPTVGKEREIGALRNSQQQQTNFYSPSNNMQKIHKIFTYNAQYFTSKNVNINPEETLPASSSHVWI